MMASWSPIASPTSRPWSSSPMARPPSSLTPRPGPAKRRAPRWPRRRSRARARSCGCSPPARRRSSPRWRPCGRWPACSSSALPRSPCASRDPPPSSLADAGGFRYTLDGSAMFSLIPREVRFFDLFEQQSQHMIQGAALLYELVHNFADARAKAHAIKEVEHQGDQVNHEIIKWKEIYETMEIVTDRCEDVANVIEGIILKMA